MPVYLDHNATTALDGRVLQAMLPYLREHYGNPSSVHSWGRMARAAIDQAREQVAALVNAHPSQVVFTSGGTEANNLALKGTAARMAVGRAAISAIEHASLLGPAQALARQGWSVDSVAVDDQCRILLSSLSEALNNRPRLVSVMMANNETGVIQDIATIGAQARAAGAVVHTDASQAAGKIPVDFFACGAHLMTLSAHKMYGPKGVGALIVDKALEIEPLLHGGGHEMGRRGGTENVAGIVGFGAAAELARDELAERGALLSELRNMLETRLRDVAGVVVFAEQAECLPNTVMIGAAGIDGEMLLMNLDRKGIAVSSGSACASGKPSHVLLAMGVAGDLARGAIRISLGKDNTRQDVENFVAVLREQIGRLRAPSVSAWE